ncbi:MAG TPA: D-2-hydroxyacid dehydrogenase family protein [Microthrixaceae bacterium]|nr:D-2-hydroxyacid dehydrogenase family protein [Microthrixaceae bacterium]
MEERIGALWASGAGVSPTGSEFLLITSGRSTQQGWGIAVAFDEVSGAIRIAVLDDYQNLAASIADWSKIERKVELDSITEHISDRGELVERLKSCQVVVAMRERTSLNAALFGLLPNLELVVTTGPSNAVIDVAAAREAGIEVCGTGGYLTPTSEHTWALILALLRHVPAEDQSIRTGGWQNTLGTELAGKVLGIVGLGRLGALVADVGKAFKMDVVAWSQNLTEERAHEVGVRRVERDELFSESDVVTVHLVLSERTNKLIGAAEFDMMKRTAVIVNTSRGQILDEAALVDALSTASIAGAGLDVFEVEPLPLNHPLRTMPNTVLTPHIGYVSDGLYQLFYDEIVEVIAGFSQGQVIRPVSA